MMIESLVIFEPREARVGTDFADGMPVDMAGQDRRARDERNVHSVARQFHRLPKDHIETPAYVWLGDEEGDFRHL